MTVFTYNQNVPFATNNPSVDQPQMLINTVSDFGIWNVDHVGFNTTNIIGNPNASGGQHLRVTFNGKNPPGFTPTDPISALYTVNGVATNNSEMRFLNALNVAFPVSLIRAYGVFDTNGNIVDSQAINLSCSGFTGGGGYAMVLEAGAVSGDSYGVLILAQSGGLNPAWIPVYIIDSATLFAVGFRLLSSSGGLGQPDFGFTCIVFQL